ncbi:MAG: hypothetical protein IJ756_01030 [Paludibacteraceae bacterium]|nr:hypothetical protein [Paludibacteraceae bacterium]
MKIANYIRKKLQPYRDKRNFERFLQKYTKPELQDNLNKMGETIGRHSQLKVIGGGPSAGEAFLEQDDCDYMVVNAYAVVPDYKKYKPKYYVVMDIMFFEEEVLTATWEKIINDTTWEMYFFMPIEMKTTKVASLFERNPLIKVVYFNGNTYHSAPEAKRDYAYDHNLALPNPDNVIVGCLYIGIMLKYPIIKMYGVEYDFIHGLHVDENNKVYFTSRHCYDEDIIGEKSVVIEPPVKTDVETNLMGYVNTLRSYKEIKKIAERHNVKIYNCTKKSIIDVFDRLK